MKEKNNNIIFYLIGIVILCGIAFVAIKEVSPNKTHVETEISVNK